MFQTVHSNHVSPNYHRDAWKLERARDWDSINRLASQADRLAFGSSYSLLGTAWTTGIVGICAVGIATGPAMLGWVAVEEMRRKKHEGKTV